jgi:hypothetical protein
MNAFIYLIAEGVTDVTLITRILRRYLAMTRIKTRADLPDRARAWLDSFKWPVGGDIARLAVPAPVFMQSDSVLVAVRNAQGLDQIQATLDADNETLFRIDWRPDALGVLVDADNKKPSERFVATRDKIETFESFPSLGELRDVAEVAASEGDGCRAGIFVFPDATTPGTIENVLLRLGAMAFPELHNASQEFIESWSRDHWHETPFHELRKPAGVSKAQLSTMASLLKPGKNLNASLQDQEWVPKGSPPDLLKPLFDFLQAVVGTEAE